MAAHLDHWDSGYREALADYNTGCGSDYAFRALGHRCADTIPKGLDMARTTELAALRQNCNANHSRKLAALGHLGEVIQAVQRAGEAAFRTEDRRRVMTAGALAAVE
ncbi:MAG: hypothetical protein OXG43_12735 [Chloroflexi bacterium]|nr:hypothetical protein [Chloroflexota bacterium]